MRLNHNTDMEPQSKWIIADQVSEEYRRLLYVQEVGDFIVQEGYCTQRVGLNSYLFQYTLSGRGVLEYGGESYTLDPGRFFLIDCHHRHRYYAGTESGRWRMVWVHFSGPWADTLYSRFTAVGGGVPAGTAPAGNTMAQQVYALLQLYENQGGPATDVRAAATLQGLLAECIETAARVSLSAAAAVRTARDYLASHCTEKVTLEDLGRVVNMNGGYLQRLFKQQTGQTPAEYQAQLRLARIKELLRSTRKSIAEISELTGLGTSSYLIRFFQKYEEITPAAYRKQWSL